jgi:hypothetical protein
MMGLSVLSPTANQPLLLRRALKSVARQSGVDQIQEVLVSENLKNWESENICRQFTNLPIRYLCIDLVGLWRGYLTDDVSPENVDSKMLLRGCHGNRREPHEAVEVHRR